MAKSLIIAAHKFLAPWLSIVVFGAPIPTLKQVAKDRSVGNLPLLPYTSMVVSAFLWMTYGWLVQQPTIYMSNLVGMVMGLYYAIQFSKYAPTSSATLPGSVRHHIMVVAFIVATTLFFCTLLSSSRETSVIWIGRVAVVFCLILFASPLAALRTVLRTQSATCIPWPFTIASTVNCWAWVVVGVWDMQDPNVYITNGIALMFGLVQIGLKLVFKDGPEKKAEGSAGMRLGLLHGTHDDMA